MKLLDSMSLTFDDQQGLVVLLSLLAAVAGEGWTTATLVGRNTLSSIQAGQRTHRWSPGTKTQSYTQYLKKTFELTGGGGEDGRVLTHQCGRPRPAILPDSYKFPGLHRHPRSCSPEDKLLQ